MKNFVLLLLPFLLPMTLWAQQTGSIVGTVRDSSGAVIPGAILTLANTGTEFHRDVTTNERGEYVAPSLPIGGYIITVNKQGSKSSSEQALRSPPRQRSPWSCNSP